MKFELPQRGEPEVIAGGGGAIQMIDKLYLILTETHFHTWRVSAIHFTRYILYWLQATRITCKRTIEKKIDTFSSNHQRVGNTLIT